MTIELKYNFPSSPYILGSVIDPRSSRALVGYVGLINQGSTCYLSTTLQMLYHLSYFRSSVYGMTLGNEDNTNNISPIPKALQELFFQMQERNTAPSTKALTTSFKWMEADVFVQHDIQEMLTKLRDNLEEKMKGTPSEGTINWLFEGRGAYVTQTLDKSYTTRKLDTFYDIHLPITSNNIYGSIQSLLVKDRLTGTNKYKIESDTEYDSSGKPKCTFHDAERGYQFLRFPPVICFHLKRFEIDMYSPDLEQKKVNDYFSFETTIDLRQFEEETKKRDNNRKEDNNNEEEQKGVTVIIDDDSDKNKKKRGAPEEVSEEDDLPIYDLQSVIVHRGDVRSGHYYCYIRKIELHQPENDKSATAGVNSGNPKNKKENAGGVVGDNNNNLNDDNNNNNNATVEDRESSDSTAPMNFNTDDKSNDGAFGDSLNNNNNNDDDDDNEEEQDNKNMTKPQQQQTSTSTTHPNLPYVDGIWLEFDDENVRVVSESTAVNGNFGGFKTSYYGGREYQQPNTNSAYMLTYIRRCYISQLLKECSLDIIPERVKAELRRVIAIDEARERELEENKKRANVFIFNDVHIYEHVRRNVTDLICYDGSTGPAGDWGNDSHSIGICSASTTPGVKHGANSLYHRLTLQKKDPVNKIYDMLVNSCGYMSPKEKLHLWTWEHHYTKERQSYRPCKMISSYNPNSKETIEEAWAAIYQNVIINPEKPIKFVLYVEQQQECFPHAKVNILEDKTNYIAKITASSSQNNNHNNCIIPIETLGTQECHMFNQSDNEPFIEIYLKKPVRLYSIIINTHMGGEVNSTFECFGSTALDHDDVAPLKVIAAWKGDLKYRSRNFVTKMIQLKSVSCDGGEMGTIGKKRRSHEEISSNSHLFSSFGGPSYKQLPHISVLHLRRVDRCGYTHNNHGFSIISLIIPPEDRDELCIALSKGIIGLSLPGAASNNNNNNNNNNEKNQEKLSLSVDNIPPLPSPLRLVMTNPSNQIILFVKVYNPLGAVGVAGTGGTGEFVKYLGPLLVEKTMPLAAYKVQILRMMGIIPEKVLVGSVVRNAVALLATRSNNNNNNNNSNNNNNNNNNIGTSNSSSVLADDNNASFEPSSRPRYRDPKVSIHNNINNNNNNNNNNNDVSISRQATYQTFLEDYPIHIYDEAKSSSCSVEVINIMDPIDTTDIINGNIIVVQRHICTVPSICRHPTYPSYLRHLESQQCIAVRCRNNPGIVQFSIMMDTRWVLNQICECIAGRLNEMIGEQQGGNNNNNNNNLNNNNNYNTNSEEAHFIGKSSFPIHVTQTDSTIGSQSGISTDNNNNNNNNNMSLGVENIVLPQEYVNPDYLRLYRCIDPWNPTPSPDPIKTLTEDENFNNNNNINNNINNYNSQSIYTGDEYSSSSNWEEDESSENDDDLYDNNNNININNILATRRNRRIAASLQKNRSLKRNLRGPNTCLIDNNININNNLNNNINNINNDNRTLGGFLRDNTQSCPSKDIFYEILKCQRIEAERQIYISVTVTDAMGNPYNKQPMQLVFPLGSTFRELAYTAISDCGLFEAEQHRLATSPNSTVSLINEHYILLAIKDHTTPSVGGRIETHFDHIYPFKESYPSRPLDATLLSAKYRYELRPIEPLPGYDIINSNGYPAPQSFIGWGPPYNNNNNHLNNNNNNRGEVTYRRCYVAYTDMRDDKYHTKAKLFGTSVVMTISNTDCWDDIAMKVAIATGVPKKKFRIIGEDGSGDGVRDLKVSNECHDARAIAICLFTHKAWILPGMLTDGTPLCSFLACNYNPQEETAPPMLALNVPRPKEDKVLCNNNSNGLGSSNGSMWGGLGSTEARLELMN